jgi:hypothetical protein
MIKCHDEEVTMDNEKAAQCSEEDRPKSKRVYNPPILKGEGRIDEITKGISGSSTDGLGGHTPAPG